MNLLRFSRSVLRSVFCVAATNVVPFPKAQKWFEVRNETTDSADLYIYDVIGDSWVGNDAATLVGRIRDLKGKTINVRLNSPGGSVWDGVAIYNTLKNHNADVNVFIDGLAASIASIVALAGKKVVIADNAMMMIHNPWTYTAGGAADLRKTADMLDQVKETLLNTYEARTGKKRDKIAADMDSETWFTAQDAKDYGLVDEISTGQKVAACLTPEVANIFGFAKTPEKVVKAQEANPPLTVPRSVLQRKQALAEKNV